MEEIINSVMQSPENTNPNVLRSQLKAIQGEGSGGPGYSVEKQRTILFDDNVLTASSLNSSVVYGVIYENITTPTIIVTFNGNEYILEQTNINDETMGYGEFGDDGPSFTNIPFAITSHDGETRLFTESSGTYSVKIEGDKTVVTPTDEFKEAVAKSSVGVIYATFRMRPHTTDEPEKWVCDKTFDELVAAYNSGSIILGRISNYVFVMLYDHGAFSGGGTVFDKDSNKLSYYGATMFSDEPFDINAYRGSITIVQ